MSAGPDLAGAVAGLEGRRLIVTGAAGGLGQAIAGLAIAQGAEVVMTDVDDVRGKAIASQLGSRASFYRHDVTREEDWSDLITQVEQRHGKVDVLVNNAGRIEVAGIEQTTLAQWNNVMSVCATGTYLGCKHVLPALRRAGGGSIVNISSIAAMVGQPFAAAYCAAKGAVRSLTKAVAAHCIREGNGVRCNSVHPGGIDTQMFVNVRNVLLGALPEEKRATVGSAPVLPPASVARTVLFLASDASIGLNGAEIVIDEGLTVARG